MRRLSYILIISGLVIGATNAHADELEDRATALAKSQESQAAKVTALRGSGKKADFQVLLENGQCYWFSLASTDVKKLVMSLYPPNAGMLTGSLAEQTTRGEGTLGYCAKESGMHKLHTKVWGKGEYVIGLFVKEKPKGPDLGATCDKAAATNGAKRQGEFFDGEGNSLGKADRSDITVQMEAGKCYTVVGCGDPEKVKSLYLYLWGPEGKRITESKGVSATPMVGHCAKETGMFKVQAKMNSGNGKYKVAVYTK